MTVADTWTSLDTTIILTTLIVGMAITIYHITPLAEWCDKHNIL